LIVCFDVPFEGVEQTLERQTLVVPVVQERQPLPDAKTRQQTRLPQPDEWSNQEEEMGVKT